MRINKKFAHQPFFKNWALRYEKCPNQPNTRKDCGDYCNITKAKAIEHQTNGKSKDGAKTPTCCLKFSI